MASPRERTPPPDALSNLVPSEQASIPTGSYSLDSGPVSSPTVAAADSFVPLVSVVGFHHARGPEVESWFGAPDGFDPAVEYDWSLLPFMALSDGSHASEEEVSYFTLLRPARDGQSATSLFGISCTRQIQSTRLINRSADVTRSTVQKAVVVIADAQSFGILRERLSVVTQAWFAQRQFTDVDILRQFQESLAEDQLRRSTTASNVHNDLNQNLGMSLRQLLREFRWQTLVLLKCCFLQPKMLFFGSRCDRLCMMQFSLISLIPGLIQNMQDCADPELHSHEVNIQKSTTLKSSDRTSLLKYMGLPLQIFGKGSLFGPYTPLQQLDLLADFGTKSYMVGSTNPLLLQQRDRYSDILINLDDDSVNITSASLRTALALTVPDRRWIDYLTQVVDDTWDDENPDRPKTLQYVGSEEFIQVQFQDYLLSLLASVKYNLFTSANPANSAALLTGIEGNPAADFGLDWTDAWARTENYRIWNTNTDSHIFDIIEPKHPCAGGLTIDDVQRRIAEQVRDLHLDERIAQGREVLGRNLAVGREKASTIFNKLYADVEALRDAQRRRVEEPCSAEAADVIDSDASASLGPPSPTFASVNLTRAQQTMQAVGSKAGAYVSSWAVWAGEKSKAGWSTRPPIVGSPSSWGLGPSKARSDPKRSGRPATTSASTATVERDYQLISSSGFSLAAEDEHDYSLLGAGATRREGSGSAARSQSPPNVSVARGS